MGRFLSLAALVFACCQVTLSAAPINDQFSLIQRRGSEEIALNVPLTHVAAVMHEAISELAGLEKSFRPFFRHMLRRNGTAMDNYTIEEYTAFIPWVMEFLSFFKNDTILQFMYAGVRNITDGFGNHSVNLAFSARELYEDTKNSSVLGMNGVFQRVKSFFTNHEQAFAVVIAQGILALRDILRVLPPGHFQNATVPVLSALEEVTVQEASTYIFDQLLWPATEKYFDNRTTFCNDFQEAYFNLSDIDKFMDDNSHKFRQLGKSAINDMSGLLAAYAPDVAPEVVAFSNISISSFSDVFESWNISLHLTKDALYEVGTYRLDCHWVRPEESGAVGSRLGLGLLVALAVAAWTWPAAE
eukprot:CAMPEP_0171170692 /NCGR_PEP_ID=MMETSP0790-20130122/8840_1 /TAXON_ID=2925 /ORGANISM="Alexandrium catenella, Strain OF101" /LENGTH=356 /DNA_ID=CAMNT_0011635537 /DNA_START=62 /DNA_END=1132 /DNA_ORIENTATION=-